MDDPSSSTGTAATPPGWAARALADAPRHEDCEVAGRRVHLRRWGSGDGRRVVLVHGGAAHSGWWDPVAPLLAQGREVVALDLTGHGDSSHEEQYGLARWAEEVLAVAGAGGPGPAPVLVGHSLGGWVALAAAAQAGDGVAGLVVIDSPLFDAPPEEATLRARRRPTRVYADPREPVGRFTTIPPQETVLPWVREHLVPQSLRQVEGGWTWKFDPEMFGNRTPLRPLMPDVRCRALLLRCEHGLLTPTMAEEMAGLLGGGADVVELVDTGHHPMLDRPLVLATVLSTALALTG